MRVVVLSLHDVGRGNGGTARTDAFASAFVKLGWETLYAYPDEGFGERRRLPDVRYVEAPSGAVGQRPWPSQIRAVKRLLAPIPVRLGSRSANMAATLEGVGSADLIILPSSHATRYAAALPSAKVWLDFHDMLSAVARREATFRRFPMATTARAQAVVLARQEGPAARHANIVTAAGFADSLRLNASEGVDATWLPNPVAVDSKPPPANTGRVGFLGDFAFSPNLDALLVLEKEWLGPLEAAGWKVVVAGRNSDGLRLPNSVESLGPLESVATFYRHVDAAVVPVRRGGGMKVKVVEALVHGRPVMTTKFALEGFDSLPAVYEMSERRPELPPQLSPPTDSEQRQLRDQFSQEAFTRAVERALSAAIW